MNWFNYAASSVDTALDQNVILSSGSLIDTVEKLPPNKTLYHCYYDLEERKTFVGYDGMLKPVWDTIHIDFDSEDGGTKAWEDVKSFAKQLQNNNISFHVYFSGNKGFHVAIHASNFGIGAAKKDENQAKIKAFLANLKKSFETTDLRIWNANRKFRAVRSQHEKSKLYKIRLTGLGLKLSSMSIEDIRSLASVQQSVVDAPIVFPESSEVPNPWIVELIGKYEVPTERSAKASLKQVPQGLMVVDESTPFQTFLDKKCVSAMKQRLVPGFNRHDIAMRIIYDEFAKGTPESDVRTMMDAWATKHFGGEQSRIDDMARLIRDAYHKPQTYQFGCYDDIKKAYCSAKCKIFKVLSPEKRAQPLDMTDKQAAQSKDKGPNELEIVSTILDEHKDLCVRSDEVFQWVETHWKKLDREQFDHELFQTARLRLGDSATSSRIDSVVRHVVASLPRAPEQNNLFNSPIDMFNFQDGTYHVWQGSDGKTKIERRDHNPKDFIAYCSPFPLRGSTDLPRNGDFLEYLEIRKADQPTPELGAQTVRAIKQTMGAALIPFRPRTIFFSGESNSGKSTLITLMTKLVGDGNWCELDPCEKSPFALETAMGKTMNICMELDRTMPLNDAMLKKARDRMPIFIQRKFKQNLKGIIPGLHVFACNELPPSAEGNTGALKNRFTVFEFKKGYLNGKSGIGDLAAHYWQTDSGTVLDVAREGLEDLIMSDFKYFVPDSGTATLEAWQTDSDPIGAFIRDLRSGEAVLAQEKGISGGFILGSELYEQFGLWTQVTGYSRKTTRHKFYNALRKKHKIHSMDRGKGGVRFSLDALSPQLSSDPVTRCVQVDAIRQSDNAPF